MTTYYVSPSGNNSNAGTSPGAGAWLNVTKVNSSTYNGGDSVLFEGGQTFSGAVVLGVSNWGSSPTPTPALPVTIGSYVSGGATATISPGSADGIQATNIGSITIRDLVITGDSTTGTTGNYAGVHLINSQAGNTKLTGVSIINITASLFKRQYSPGIQLEGTNGSSGYDGAIISGCTCHDNIGYGIVVSGANYGSGATTPSITNLRISYCVCYNNAGDASGANNGHGINLGQTGGSGLVDVTGVARGGIVEYCETYNNGTASSFGPVGAWSYDSSNVVFQFCESYSNATTGSNDGNGFDIDGGNVNCGYQFCYSHDNQGAGFLLYSYNDGSVTASSGSFIRFCISQNDGIGGGSNSAAGIYIANDATLTGIQVYNNTIYASRSGAPCVLLGGTGGSGMAGITGHVANNILYAASGIKFINQRSAANPSGLHFDGNDYYTPGTPSITWNGTTYTVVATWAAAVTQETVNGGFTSNPLLLSAGLGATTHGYVPTKITSYALKSGSPMIGVGINLNSQFSINPGTQDYYGKALPNGNGTGYNVGAYNGAAIPLTTVFVTSGTTYAIPADWSSFYNSVECIGAGGGGRNGGSAGGGGSYSNIANLSLTPSTVVTIQVGVGGTGGAAGAPGIDGTAGTDTWFNGASGAAASVWAIGGGGTSGATPGAGGSGGTGTIKNAGGSGGGATGGGAAAGPGGGGAGGPGGVGGNGGPQNTTNSGGGGSGGANGGGANGVVNASSTGATGGASISIGNQVGHAGGAGSTSGGSPGSAGTAGSGGGGGFGNEAGSGSAGGAGGPGTEFDASHGSGGGGGGGGSQGTTDPSGGNGGLYGGGGSGAGSAATRGKGGNGAGGLIVITYTPSWFVFDPRRQQAPVLAQ